jgi:hypothetical protein
MAEWQEASHGPYGEDGDVGGEYALELLDNLLAPKTVMPFAPDETPRWDKSDQDGFEWLFALQDNMDYLDPAADLDAPATGHVAAPWHCCTVALPFSESERYWLIDAQRRHWRSYPQRDPEVPLSESIVGVETTVMSGGLRRALHGRDLVRRWASWRREADEFAGQGGLTTALFLLDHLAYELVPDEFSKPDFSERFPHVAEFDARATQPRQD